VRTVDRVVRVGGEEFGLILMQTDRTAALEVGQRVCATMRDEDVTIEGSRGLKVTVSAGVAVLPQDARNGAELVAAADKALYAAKNGGRDRVAAA
jgi:diguanylate cyclase (GGDEF)-like protein